MIDDAERRLTDLIESSTVNDEPDGAWVDQWLHRCYLAHWTGTS